MKRVLTSLLFAGSLILAAPAPADAQQQDFLAVGEEAPDIEVTGATRHGVIRGPVRLSDYRGETVVLAFFFRARTRG